MEITQKKKKKQREKYSHKMKSHTKWPGIEINTPSLLTNLPFFIEEFLFCLRSRVMFYLILGLVRKYSEIGPTNV